MHCFLSIRRFIVRRTIVVRDMCDLYLSLRHHVVSVNVWLLFRVRKASCVPSRPVPSGVQSVTAQCPYGRRFVTEPRPPQERRAACVMMLLQWRGPQPEGQAQSEKIDVDAVDKVGARGISPPSVLSWKGCGALKFHSLCVISHQCLCAPPIQSVLCGMRHPIPPIPILLFFFCIKEI